MYTNNKDAVNSSIKDAILKQLGQRINVDNTMISTQSLLNNISILLPKTVSYTNYINGELTNVDLSYDSIKLKPINADSYTVINFQKPTSNNNANQNQIKDVANKLSLLINDPIELIDYNYTVQQSLSSQENEQTLIKAIKNAIEVNIIENGIDDENSKESYLNINNIIYSINEIMKNLTINLNHNFVISQEYNDGYLTGVTLFFHGLNNVQSQIQTQTNKTYKVINFLKPTASDYETNDNHISNGLSNSVLTNGTIILPTDWNLTAAQSLQTSNISNLESYITSWLSNTLTDYVNKQTNNDFNNNKYFVINHVGYTVSQIISEINLILPNSAQAGLINTSQIIEINITFSKNNFQITNTQFDKIFKVTGFKNATNNNAWPTSQETATILNQAILNPINLNNPNVFSSTNLYQYDVAQSISINTTPFVERMNHVLVYDIEEFIKKNPTYSSTITGCVDINGYAVTYSELASWIKPNYVSALIGVNSNVNNSMQYDYLKLYVTSANDNAQSVQLQCDNLTNYVVIGFHDAIKPNDDPNANNIVDLLTPVFGNILESTFTLQNWELTVA